MSNVIVFGGSGLVGASLIKHLSETTYNVLAPSSREVNLLDEGSVLNYANSLAKTKAFTLIIVAAAVPYNAVKHDDYDTMFNNVIMANNIIKAFVQVNIHELIYVSTLDVYAKGSEKLTEASQIEPRSNYAIFKFAAEMLLKKFSREIKTSYCCLRLSHIYDVDDTSPKVINAFFDSAFKTSSINISGNKNTLRDFVYNKDVSKVIAAFINEQVNDTVNIATGNAITLDFLAQCISNCFEKEININYVNPNADNNDIHFDIKKLRKYYQPEFTSISEVIKEIYDKRKHEYIF